jgi:hypothetical protein
VCKKIWLLADDVVVYLRLSIVRAWLAWMSLLPFSRTEKKQQWFRLIWSPVKPTKKAVSHCWTVT